MLGFGDEVWWCRLAQPATPAWAPGEHALRLVEQALSHDEPAPKALACYGLLLRVTSTAPEQIWLRCATGQPVSGLTTQLLVWCCTRLAALQKRTPLLVGDQASWHTSQEGRRWLRTHHRHVKQIGHGVRIGACRRPSKCPWLNPSERKWVHRKQAVVEADRLLNAQELAARVWAYYGCAQEAHLFISQVD